MKIALWIVAFAVLFVLITFAQIWLWRACATPITRWPVPTFWQMLGIDMLGGSIAACGNGASRNRR